jgi:MFS family permease
MALTDNPGRQSEWARGWRPLLAAFAGNGVGFSMFLMVSGIFIIPMQQQFGLSRTAASIGAIVGLAVAFLTPLAAHWVDRYGPRGFAIAGLLGLACAYGLMAVLPAHPVIFYALAAMMALAGPVSNPMIYCRGVVTWFSRHAGLAFGITMCGTSLITAIASPVLSDVVVHHGWRWGYALWGAIVVVCGLPLVIAWFRENPDPLADVAGARDRAGSVASARDAARTIRFWLVFGSLACATLAIGGIISQLYPILIAGGYSPELAAGTVSFYAVSMGVGRVVAGFLLDRFEPVWVAGCTLLLAACGSLLLLFALFGGGPWMLAFLAAFMLGWGQGAEGDYLGFFTQHLFGRQAFAAIYSWFNLAVGSGLALGGLLFASLFDHYGNYHLAVTIGGGLWLASAALMLALRWFDRV